MFKVILKKQLKEFKYSYYKNRKTGKLKKGLSAFWNSVLYFLIYVCVSFTFFGITMGTRIYVDTKDTMWVMFSIMSFLTIFATTFLNMFITKGILFDAKDNEFLLSLPINDSYIIIARMLNVFLNSLIYVSMMWIPAIVNYQIFYGFDVMALIYGLILLLLITIIVSSLSCLFGYLLSLLFKKTHTKSLFQSLFTLIFLGLYYVVYFNINKIMSSLLADLNKLEAVMKTKVILLYSIALAATGNNKYLVIAILLTTAIFIVCFVLIISRYRKLLITNPITNKKEFKGKFSKQSSVHSTLIKRELKHFFSNSSYTVNCGLAVVIIIAAIIALLIFRNNVGEFLFVVKEIPMLGNSIPVILLVSISLLVGMDSLSIPAVSLEGQNYWIIRTLPVSTYDVLNSKRLLQFRMHVIPTAILAVVCSFIFQMSEFEQIIFILCCIEGCSFISYVDLFIGIKFATLNWTDEITVIKQSGGVTIAILGDMIGYTAIGFGYVLFFNKYLSVEIFMLCILVIYLLFSVLINLWVKTKGVKEFEELG